MTYRLAIERVVEACRAMGYRVSPKAAGAALGRLGYWSGDVPGLVAANGPGGVAGAVIVVQALRDARPRAAGGGAG